MYSAGRRVAVRRSYRQRSTCLMVGAVQGNSCSLKSSFPVLSVIEWGGTPYVSAHCCEKFRSMRLNYPGDLSPLAADEREYYAATWRSQCDFYIRQSMGIQSNGQWENITVSSSVCRVPTSACVFCRKSLNRCSSSTPCRTSTSRPMHISR